MYRKQISRKASPLLRATPINQGLQSQSCGSLSSVVQRAQQDPDTVTGDERQQLESAIGTRSTREFMAGKQTPWMPEFRGISSELWGHTGEPIQAKLTIGAVGDKYEQEADRIAVDVVQRINQPEAVVPQQGKTVQRQEVLEDEELQMKPLVQGREAIAGGQASTDLASAINSARGDGQPLDAGLQRLMGQAMGADFSGVKVHTDPHADQLNKSIQAKAFTTGQDVFFRQGTYDPGSRGGKELIAHELTHVVQQNGGAMQRRSPQEQISVQPLSKDRSIQRKFGGDLETLTDEEIVGELTQMGYSVGNVTKWKIKDIRNKKDDTIFTLNELAQKLIPKIAESTRKDVGQVIGGNTTWAQGSSIGKVTVTAAAKEHRDFGKLFLSYKFTNTELEFEANITSNPALIWSGGDIVSVTLQPATLNVHMGDLLMFGNANAVTINGKYTFEDLAKLGKITLPSGTVTGRDKRQAIAQRIPQMGVLATWRTQDGKGEQHRSGGMDQKGGSGLINVISEISEETLAKTESIRNVGWNEGELMKEGRPIYNKFPNLIQLEKEMATTLEAESEYMVDEKQFEKILSDMQRLASMSHEDLLSTYGIMKQPKAETKIYTDTYYDLGVISQEDKSSFPLLDSDIVFRRRSVPTDEEGTNLISVKGRSQISNDKSEAIRLAAQFQAKYDFLKPEKQKEIREFLRTEKDNAFGRVLRDALKSHGREDILTEDFTIKKSLTVRSERTKYKLWLASSTMIDFSADKAFGSTEQIPEKPENVVYSFEFGVGHPGLAATSSSTGELAEEDPQLEKIKKSTNSVIRESRMSDYLSKRQALVHRPYHVPQDVENQNLFAKGDFIQYKNLRNAIIDNLFKLKRDQLLKGGNKAKVLAQKMGLMSG